MDIHIHLKLIDLTEDLQQVVASSRGAAHDDHCDDSLLVVQQQQQQHLFESLVRNTVTKCGVQEVITDTTSDKNNKNNKNNKNINININSNINTTTTIKRTNAVHSEDVQTEEVISSILRYVKIKDRYMAFCSLLLKSFLHHSFSSGGLGDVSSSSSSSRSNHLGEETPVCKKRKIHILPRTKEGKPYIVVMKEKDNEKTTTTTSPSLPFNISHQFPFVGAAYLDSSNGLYPQHEISNSPWIGLDIVSFDSYNETKHLYSCQDEYLNMFQDYFTVKEWAHIQSAHDLGGCRIKEFLLRWSIKEAYTKAIGTGMMTSFCSFESSLYHVGNGDDDDEEEEKEECREEVILLSSDEILSKRTGTHFFARIQPMSVDGPNTALEKNVFEWQIIFVPLFTGNEDEQIMQTTPQPSAFACICYPIGSETTFSFKDHYRIEISSFKLSDLIRFHNPSIGE